MPRSKSGFFSRVGTRVSDWGLRRAVYWQIMSFLARRLGMHLNYVFVSSGSSRMRAQPMLESPPGYRVRVVDLSDLLPHAGTVPALSKEFIASATERGDNCVATFYGEALVGFSFQTSTRASVTRQLEILVPAGFKYTYKTWIHSDHRKKNLSQIQGSVRSHTSGPTSERGIWYVATHNYPSLLHGYRHPRDRALHMGFMGWLKVSGREIPFASRTAKRLGVELVQKGSLREGCYI